MDELVASVAGVVDNMSGECFVQRFDQLVRAKRLSGAHQHIERKIAADYRGERENLIAGRGQKVEAAADHLLQPFGNPDDPG